MPANKEDITIKVGADLAGALEGIGSLVGKINGIASRGNIVKGVLGGAFVFASNEIRKTVEEMENLNHELVVASRNSGLSVEDVQGFSKNAEKYGKSLDDIVNLSEKFEVAMDKARKEGPHGATRMAFEKLGINLNASAPEAFKQLSINLEKSGGTMAHINELADIFGAKMVKNVKPLQENLDAAKASLESRGALISDLTSRQIEDVRKLDKEMGTYGSRFFRTAHRAEFALAISTAQASMKNLVILADEAFSIGPGRVGFKKAWSNFGDRAGEIQASQGFRMGPNWLSPVEYENMAKKLENREARRVELKGEIKDLQYELRTPLQKLTEAQSEVEKLKKQYAAYPATSTSVEKSQTQRDLLAAQLEVKKLQEGAKGYEFQSNPFLQVGGLLGVDMSARLANDIARTANNTDQMVDLLSQGGLANHNTPPAHSPLSPISGPAYTGQTSPTGGRNFTVAGTSVTGIDFSK